MQVRSIFMRLTGYFISNINQRMAIYSAENVAMVGEEFRRLGVLTAVIASFQTTVSDQKPCDATKISKRTAKCRYASLVPPVARFS